MLNRILVYLFIPFIFSAIIAGNCIAQESKTDQKPVSQAIHDKAHQDVLIKYKEGAENYRAKNLNRFGIYELQRYDASLDSLYKKEMNDTLASIKTNYLKVNESRNVALGSLNAQIKQLSNQKEDAQARFSKLLKKAAIAFALWLIIVFILMQLRSRTLKMAELRLNNSKTQLLVSQQNFEKGNDLLQFATSQKEKLHQLVVKDAELQKEVIEKLPSFDLSVPKEEMTQIQSKLKNLHSSSSLNEKLTGVILSQQKDMEEEKVPVNLNQLCDQCMDAVYYGMMEKWNDGTIEANGSIQTSIPISIAKDLEKNLPSVKANPDAVNYLLLNVLNNAFVSVYEKYKHNLKGYTPKVSISTRVLPRFLQIRVKDNGNGMTDEIMAHVHQPFYSAWSNNESAGLGMHFSKKIITETHKGEIKIESQPGDGTDVYLKFYV